MSAISAVAFREILARSPEYGANLSAMPASGSGPRYIRITDIDAAGRLLRDDIRRIPDLLAKQYILEENDILIARTGNTVGKAYIHRAENGHAAFAGYLIRFRIDECAGDPAFIFQFLHSPYYYAWIENTLRTGAQPNINASEYMKMPIPAFALPQQRRIAEILSTVDEAIEATEALITKYQQIKSGLMHDLFTRGVTPDGRLRPPHTEAPDLYKESPLGPIPKEWRVGEIGRLFKRRIERGRAGLPVMSITMAGGLIPRNSVDRRVESALTPEQHLLVKKDDIAYNMMRMWQGVLGRADYDCLVSPAYIVMEPTIEPVA